MRRFIDLDHGLPPQLAWADAVLVFRVYSCGSTTLIELREKGAACDAAASASFARWTGIPFAATRPSAPGEGGDT